MSTATSFYRVLPTALLGCVLASGAALAQAIDEPLGRNQSEGQLLPVQAEEVAPLSETLDQDTTGDVPTGIEVPTQVPAINSDEGLGYENAPDADDSLTGKVQEEEEADQ